MKVIIIKTKDLGKNLERIFDKGMPDVFGQEFLNDLGLEESNNVLFIKLFTELGLIDSNQKPTDTYYQLIKSNQPRSVIADLVRKTYYEIFESNTRAHRLQKNQVYDLFRKKMGEERSDTLIHLVADTFLGLVEYAEWKSPAKNGVKSYEKPIADEKMNDGVKAYEKSIAEKRSKIKAEKTPAHSQIPAGVAEISNGIAESPHEEFLLELMNGVDEHKYEHKKNGNEEVIDTANAAKPDTKRKIKTTPWLNNNSSNSDTDSVKKFICNSMLRRAELLKGMDRDEEAITAYNDIIRCFEEKKYPIETDKVLNAYYQKARALEKTRQFEKALGVYDDFIARYG